MANPKRMTFLVTNDVHSRHFGFASEAGEDLGGSARRASYFKEQRKKYNGNVITLDVGDVFLGSDFFTFFDGEVEMKVMESLGYEAMAVGNHDFDQGGLPNLLKQSIHAPSVTLLCANLFKASDSSFVFAPYKIIQKGGLKVAIAGLLGQSAWDVIPNEYREGLVFQDIQTAAVNVSKLMREKENPDITVCLSHNGYRRGDRDLCELGLFDLVFSGHEHMRPLSEWISVPYKDEVSDKKESLLHPGNWGGRAVAKVTLEVAQSGGTKVVEKSTDVIDSSFEESLGIASMLNSYKERYSHIAEEKIATCHNELCRDYLSNNYRLSSSLPLSEFICLAFRRFFSPPAEIGIVNLGGIRAGIPKGTVTWSTINKLWPFQDDIHQIKLHGAHLNQILERNLHRVNTTSGSGMVRVLISTTAICVNMGSILLGIPFLGTKG